MILAASQKKTYNRIFSKCVKGKVDVYETRYPRGLGKVARLILKPNSKSGWGKILPPSPPVSFISNFENVTTPTLLKGL